MMHVLCPLTLPKKLVTLLDLCVSSLRSDHANLLCIVPMLGCTRHPEIVSRPGPPWPCKKKWLRFSILVCEKMFTLLDFGVQKIVYTSRFWCAKKCLHFSILVCKKLLTLLDFGVQTIVYTSRFWSARKNAYTSRFWCAENCLHFSIFVYKKKVYTYRLVCVVLAQGPC